MVNSESDKEKESGWQSIRERWTVSLAITILMVSFFVIIGILIYLIWQRDTTLLDKIITIFNAFLMAVLGYLFGYVPAKNTEEIVKKDKMAIEKQTIELENVITEYETTLRKQEKTIKDYELILAMYEEE